MHTIIYTSLPTKSTFTIPYHKYLCAAKLMSRHFTHLCTKASIHNDADSNNKEQQSIH